MTDKITLGQFYTAGNPFILEPFLNWVSKIDIKKHCILEPFAGSNNLITTLRDMNLCKYFNSYDIVPDNKEVEYRDSINNFPQNYKVCITNPPWLAKNSAKRKNIPFITNKYDDLYKICLELCLENCDYIAILVPATFLQSKLFRSRLHTYILLHSPLFTDTETPVCLCLFNKEETKDTLVYYDNEYIGELNVLIKEIPEPKTKKDIIFNDPRGELGFISFDNTKAPSIRFCNGKDINHHEIKQSSRFITKIGGDFNEVDVLVEKLNKAINNFRFNTKDLFLTTFKGLRNDGSYRRRMEYKLARCFINAQ